MSSFVILFCIWLVLVCILATLLFCARHIQRLAAMVEHEVLRKPGRFGG